MRTRFTRWIALCLCLTLTAESALAPVWHTNSPSPALSEQALSPTALAFGRRITHTTVITLAALGFAWGAFPQPIGAQTAPGQNIIVIGKPMAPDAGVKLEEAWVQKDLLGSARKLFDAVKRNNLSAADLKAWNDRYVRPVRPGFTVGVLPQTLSPNELYLFWDRFVEEVLVPGQFIAYPGYGKDPDRIARIVQPPTQRISPAGHTVPILIVRPLRGTPQNAYTTLSYIVIPEDYIGDETIRRTWAAHQNSQAIAQIVPNLPESAKPLDNAKALGEWVAVRVMRQDQGLAHARDLLEQIVIPEELDHWDVLHELQKREGRSPFSFTPVEWLDAIYNHLYTSKQSYDRQRAIFEKYNETEKTLLIERTVEIHAQLAVLSRVKDPTNVMLGYNLFLNNANAAAAAVTRKWLSLPVLGKDTDSVQEWTTGLAARLTRGFILVEGPTTRAANEEKLKANIESLNQDIRKGARDAFQEVFKPIAPVTSDSIGAAPGAVTAIKQSKNIPQTKPASANLFWGIALPWNLFGLGRLIRRLKPAVLPVNPAFLRSA